MASRRPLPVREPVARLDRGRPTERFATRATSTAASWARRPCGSARRTSPGSRRSKFAELRAEPEIERHVGPLRADLRWPRRAAGAAARQPSAVREVRGADGVDDDRADAARRRARGDRARRRERLPAALVYDNEGKLDREGRARRLQGVVAHVVRQAHAVGRLRVARARHRGRDRARTRPLRAHHARRREAEDPQAQGRPRARRAGPTRRRAVPVARRRARGRGRRRTVGRGRTRRDPR